MEPVPIFQKKFIRPQRIWKWEIAIYLFLAGMGAGSFIIGTIIQWWLNPSELIQIPILNLPFDLAKAAILWGPILVAIAAPFLILDLGIKRRFLYACLNPRTSWVARGFIILSLFIISGLFFLAKSIFPFEWLHGGFSLWSFLQIIAFGSALATLIYTGILLKATKSIPLWNTSFLPILFLISGLSTGLMAIILTTLGANIIFNDLVESKPLMYAILSLIVIEGIVLYLFLSNRYKISEKGRDSVHLLLFGEKRFIFWGVDIFLGLICPFILIIIIIFYQGNWLLVFASGIALLSGSFFLRLGLLSVGIKDEIPMRRWAEFQYNLNQNPKPEYRNPKKIQNANFPIN